MNERRIISLEQGWGIMQKGITKLKYILEGYPEPRFSSEQYMMLYTTVFNMCTQHPPHNYARQLYEKYRESVEEYITSMVLPSLREKHDDDFVLLSEFVKRWSNHKLMVRLLSGFFSYLDRFFTRLKSVPPLKEVGLACFRDLVYSEMKGKVRDAVISLIDQEREGEQIDRDLLKNVVNIFVEIGNEIVQHELLSVYATELLEKEDSGCHALLKDDKVVHLSRMYRLFSMIPWGLDLVSSMFKQHVTAEGTTLVKHAEDAASNKKALKKAFEIFCNKGVAGISIAELLATFCDNILKKGGSEILSDKTVEDTLEKVVKLLAYINDKDLFAAYYREKLARRLKPFRLWLEIGSCTDLSANDEHERSMLTKLKQQCGGQLTSKTKRMVTDLALAKENQSQLANNSNVSSGIEFDERKKVIEDVDKDRWHAIDASIVKIMKSRKVLGYQQLVMECDQQLGHMFRPDVNIVMKRIENLITRDYLERDKVNPNVFRCLA